MTQTWFTADTHFGHAGVIRQNLRPFEGIAEMREALISNWNAGVGRSCDVGVDAWSYRPVRLSEILDRIGDAVNE